MIRVVEATLRHANSDWGELDQEDVDANERSLRDGSRLLYRSKDGVRFWLITEADRSVTTALLPKDY